MEKIRTRTFIPTEILSSKAIHVLFWNAYGAVRSSSRSTVHSPLFMASQSYDRDWLIWDLRSSTDSFFWAILLWSKDSAVRKRDVISHLFTINRRRLFFRSSWSRSVLSLIFQNEFICVCRQGYQDFLLGYS